MRLASGPQPVTASNPAAALEFHEGALSAQSPTPRTGAAPNFATLLTGHTASSLPSTRLASQISSQLVQEKQDKQEKTDEAAPDSKEANSVLHDLRLNLSPDLSYKDASLKGASLETSPLEAPALAGDATRSVSPNAIPGLNLPSIANGNSGGAAAIRPWLAPSPAQSAHASSQLLPDEARAPQEADAPSKTPLASRTGASSASLSASLESASAVGKLASLKVSGSDSVFAATAPHPPASVTATGSAVLLTNTEPFLRPDGAQIAAATHSVDNGAQRAAESGLASTPQSSTISAPDDQAVPEIAGADETTGSKAPADVPVTDAQLSSSADRNAPIAGGASSLPGSMPISQQDRAEMSLQIPPATSKSIPGKGALAGHPVPEGMAAIATHDGTTGSALHGPLTADPVMSDLAISGSATIGPTVTVPALIGPAATGPASSAVAHGSASVAGLDPYQRLDQAAPAVTLHSTANRFAVGVHDPALGYLEIDAHSAAGQISAALVTNSALSHASLAAQLPSLHEYLGDQQVRLSHLGVEQQMPQGDRSAPQREGGQSPGGRASESSPAAPPLSAGLARMSQSDWAEEGESGPLPSYINVRV
ncbi:hypothetical protein HNQ77_005218 [Silvibacterium bohemicum]|uniref:Flagellar hook-length control protein-like C-terminal domain-containing protein n=1 Tax=Silvibacterium bohemicum TaxID=1577686 RepID=A0A841KAA0_9BACT|nr:flagellar hook-length control protein FliK [Silvibacterium bohemicum]MBB6147224.1 hypothetical protein [Silvibacterium bohemicum]